MRAAIRCRATGAALVAAPILLAILGAAHCAVPPAEDCTAKAICLAPDAASDPAPNADASTEAAFADASGVTWNADASMGSSDTSASDTTASDTSASDTSAGDTPIGDALGSDGPVEAAPPPVPCGSTEVCVPPAPQGFTGPDALWRGPPGSPPPPCAPAPDYGWPSDTSEDLNAPAAGCACSCAASGQECVASATVYGDRGCSQACASAVLAGSCSQVTTCPGNQGALRANSPTPIGGSCVLTTAPPTPARWNTASRMCQLRATASPHYCPTPTDVCATIPKLPYLTRPCVSEILAEGQPPPTTCPAAYPSGPFVSHWSFADARKCAPCACSPSPVGGKCTGTVSLNGIATGDCDTSEFTYSLGSACSPFALTAAVGYIAGNYTLTPGVCSITTNTSTQGVALPSGTTQVVCCL